MKFLILLAITSCLSTHAADLEGITDRNLKITLQELRGIQPRTKNNLYVKATIESGPSSFTIFCTREGQVNQAGSVNALNCAELAGTLSGDDNESLQFQITLQTNSEGETANVVEKIDYFGDGTMLGDKVRILTGMASSDRRLPRLIIELRPLNLNALATFKQGWTAIEALSPLIGEFKFSIGNDMKLSVRSPAVVEVSMLNRAGDLDSGFRTANEIERDIKTRLNLN